jgi:HlyD family secretion protein
MAEDSKSKLGGLLKPPTIMFVGALSIGAIAISVVGVKQLLELRKEEITPVASETETPSLKYVTGLGRIEPQGEVIELSASSLSEGARIEELLVEEGDRVGKGDMVAILDSRDRLVASLQEAQKEVSVQQAELAKVRAGAKQGEINAQKATISRLQAELQRSTEGQQANIAKLQAQFQREQEAQEANIARLRARLQREREAKQANLARLEAQLEREEEAEEAKVASATASLKRQTQEQQANIARLEAELEGTKATAKATFNRIKAELRTSEAEYKRYQTLYEEGAISTSLFDSKRLALESDRAELQEAEAILEQNIETIQQQINQARAELDRIQETGEQEINEAQANLQGTRETVREQIREAEAQLNQTLETVREEIREARANLDRIIETGIEQLREEEATLNRIRETGLEQIREAEANLDRISEVRFEDVQAAQASVERAIAGAKKAEAELELAFVKSPIEGRVLEINARVGERIATTSSEGIVELGRTDQMYVVAEIYETDIGRVRVGQAAIITSGAFTGELAGTVERVGMQIGKKDVLNTDPAADTDARVVEVKIRLDNESSQKVKDLTNLQVDVRILADGGE